VGARWFAVTENARKKMAGSPKWRSRKYGEGTEKKHETNIHFHSLQSGIFHSCIFNIHDNIHVQDMLTLALTKCKWQEACSFRQNGWYDSGYFTSSQF